MGDRIYVPYQEAESEFVEKRSRFIGHIWPVDSEDQAQELIRRVKKQHYDARHNCWCYLLGGAVVRYSDDGEPQGTAGQPMLAVLPAGERHQRRVRGDPVFRRHPAGGRRASPGPMEKAPGMPWPLPGWLPWGGGPRARCTCPYPVVGAGEAGGCRPPAAPWMASTTGRMSP